MVKPLHPSFEAERSNMAVPPSFDATKIFAGQISRKMSFLAAPLGTEGVLKTIMSKVQEALDG